MQILAKISLVLVVVLVSLSSYLRLDHSGIGCEPWPACYGNIGSEGETPDVGDTYERLLEEARQPLSWATPAHRLVASVLALLILSMVLLAQTRKSDRVITSLLLVLTVFLAWLGIYSEGLHSPAIVMGNLGGGFASLEITGKEHLRVYRARLHDEHGNVTESQGERNFCGTVAAPCGYGIPAGRS